MYAWKDKVVYGSRILIDIIHRADGEIGQKNQHPICSITSESQPVPKDFAYGKLFRVYVNLELSHTCSYALNHEHRAE